jgi:hypothetical protein
MPGARRHFARRSWRGHLLDDLDRRQLLRRLHHGAPARGGGRRRAHVDLAATSVLVVASAFALAGLLGSGELGFAASLVLVAASTWEYLSEKQVGGKLRAVVDAEASAGR